MITLLPHLHASAPTTSKASVRGFRLEGIVLVAEHKQMMIWSGRVSAEVSALDTLGGFCFKAQCPVLPGYYSNKQTSHVHAGQVYDKNFTPSDRPHVLLFIYQSLLAVLIYLERDELLCGNQAAGKRRQANIQHSCSVRDMAMDALSTVWSFYKASNICYIRLNYQPN